MNTPDLSTSSRRTFTRNLFAAAAALPFVSSGFSEAAQTRRGKQRPKQGPRIETHDTPPPFTVDDGSFTIESQHPFTLQTPPPPQGPYTYTSNFGGHARFSHIAVLDRFGANIHPIGNALGARIVLLLEDDQRQNLDELTIEGGNVLTVVTTSMRLLDHGHAKPQSFRGYKLEHPGRSGRRIRIKRLQIVHPSRPFLKNVTSSPSGYFSEEYRILAWFD